MASSKRRAKAQQARAAKRAQKFGAYKQREDRLPNPDTKYGARWWARRRGEGMSLRTHEPKPWFYEAVTSAFASLNRVEAPRFEAKAA